MIIMSNNDNNSDSSYEEFSEDPENTSENENVTGNAAWANSIARILKSGKPKKKRTLVLSKAKKLGDEKTKTVKTLQFEIQAADGEIKKEIVEDEANQKVDKAEQPAVRKKKQLPKLRVKPNILERDRERTLSKIATKGVVQLFNAIQTQQKTIDSQLKEAGPLEVKRDRVLKKVDKRSFLDMLMGKANSEPTKTAAAEQVNEEKSSSWNVLRDDFMMKAKMKDWDKELEQNMEMEYEGNVESD